MSTTVRGVSNAARHTGTAPALVGGLAEVLEVSSMAAHGSFGLPGAIIAAPAHADALPLPGALVMLHAVLLRPHPRTLHGALCCSSAAHLLLGAISLALDIGQSLRECHSVQ